MRQQEILIAEDQSIVARDLEHMLVRHGYRVVGTVNCGEDAVEAASSMRVDLVLMDIDLQGQTDGIDAAGMIQGEYSTPVVYLGSDPDKVTFERAKFTDPFGYIVKPVGERDLCAGIELALYKYQTEQLLSEKEKWLEGVLTQLGEGLIATDHDGRVYIYNQVAEEILGQPANQVLRRPVADVLALVDADNRPLGQDLLWNVQAQGKDQDWSGHAHLPGRNGLVAIEYTATAMKDREGRFIGATIILRSQEDARFREPEPDDSGVAI